MAVKDIWETRSHEMAQQIAVGLYPALQVSQQTLDATDGGWRRRSRLPALRRLVTESRAGVERALRAQKADAAAGSAWLAGWVRPEGEPLNAHAGAPC